jgi:ribosomal protein S27E/DNA-directed RNA polymerase subunit RPC12/RpoP
MSEARNSPEKVRRYICPGCGADLLFEPQDGSLTCPYCNRKEVIPQSNAEVVERSYEEYLRAPSNKMTTMAAGALEVKCEGCSATVTFTPPEVAGECSFCGNPIVAQPQAADPLVAPEAVLPFQITRKQADEAIKQWLSTRWFAPNALKKMAYREGVHGIYLPHWTYDAHTLSYYSGERGEHYYDTEYYTETDAQGNTVQKSRRVQRTRWYSASGQVQRWFDDVLVTATKSVHKQRLESLGAWDLNMLKPYEPAFLSGFKAQRYEVELAEGFEDAKQQMASVIDGDVRSDIGGDEQRVHDIQTSYSGITFKHILLPIYLGAYRFNQKVYQVMINARTGVVQGERPYSFWKIFILILFIIALIAVIVLIANAKK